MEKFTKTTWLSIQKARRRRKRAEQIKIFLEKFIFYSVIVLAVCGLVVIILALFGFKFSKPAEASTAQIITETIQPKIEEEKIKQVTEEPELTDDEITKTLKKVCSDNGMDDKENNEVCWQTLWAMSYQESKLNWLPTGDGGKSKGWFHIQTKLHNITEACAMDLNCSADWTLKRLISKGFPIYWTYSVQAHNGFGTEAAKQGAYAKIIEREIAALNN